MLLDASAQHGGRRGREALALSAQTMGVEEGRVDELLGLVGLDRSAARKRVRQYSLGMRQRLGIANALIGEPEVLILDEPANGLDPEGMRWMRGLLRDFAERGGTVLLSSHLVPGRSRLIVAKLFAGIVLALAATAVALVLSVFGTAIASTSAPHHWSLPLGLLLQDIVYVVTSMGIGIGFGAALLASAPAIVLYFAVPIALSALGSIHALQGPIEWINVGESSGPLTERVLGGHDWAQVLVTLAVWMVLPLAVGPWRITRGDVG
ncbi:MAG TPA: ATP-binding cassette domain-containing protein [Solirubrobacterales bacterium]